MPAREIVHQLVKQILELHKASPRTPREIESMDRTIDRLVHELYGLTGDEIKIMEEKS